MYLRHFLRPLLAAGTCAALSFAAGEPARAADIDVTRGSELAFEWLPPLEGAEAYRVFVDCNDGERGLEFHARDSHTLLYSHHCDSLRLRVAALDPADGSIGPLSDPSDRIVLVGATAPPPSSDAPDAAEQDLDGDGRTDLLVWTATGDLFEAWTVPGQKARTLAELPRLGPDETLVGEGDLDGDGFADLQILDLASGVLRGVLIKDGQAFAEAILGDVPPGWIVAGATDHDGDGRADLLLHEPLQGQLELWLMDDLLVRGAVRIAGTRPMGFELRGCGDFDGDGRSDVLWWNRGAGQLVIWLTDLERVAAAEALVLENRMWTMAAIGDFDADGTFDLALRHATSGRIEKAIVRDGQLLAFHPIALPPHPMQQVLAAGDLDGDGDDDLLIRDSKRAHVTWYSDSGQQLHRTSQASARESWVLNVGHGLPKL